jgi:N-ethylmaleimide reductase
MTTLFDPLTLGSMTLKNRMVLAPMTRSRALGNVPNAMMAQYYAQRAGGGLLVTEGVGPSANGTGYPRIPGIFNAAQIAGWKAVTEAVHTKGSRIVLQLMHTGRVGHPDNLPAGGALVAPSPLAAPGKMHTDSQGPQDLPVPREMTEADITAAIAEFVTAAKNAIEAGFDGVELHGANGYLIEQFLNPATNVRTDGWGGSWEQRNRFVLEVATAVATAIGGSRVGIRLSPHSVNQGMAEYPEIGTQYAALARGLGERGLLYVHLVDHSGMGAPKPKPETFEAIRHEFKGPIIRCGGFDLARANQALAKGEAHLIAFGRSFLANPDLPARLQQGAALNPPDFSTLYTPGEKGYLDYPVLPGSR